VMSAALHDAIACTVCRWLWTKNHLGTAADNRCRMAVLQRRFYIRYVLVGVAMLGYLTVE
jgi:hypothetical protein